MSAVAINANTFHFTGRYIKLLNTFLATLKQGPTELDESHSQHVISFFQQLQDSEAEDPSIHMVYSVIERGIIKKKNIRFELFLKSLICDLESADTESLVRKLEMIVSALDVERHRALSSIKNNE